MKSEDTEELKIEICYFFGSHAEANRIVEQGNSDVERLRSECDAYVDSRLGELEDLLSRTLRTVGRGRQQLRTPLNEPFDYEDWQEPSDHAPAN